MEPTKFKKAKRNDLYGKLQSYISTNYTGFSSSEKLERFLIDIKQNREVICRMSNIMPSVEHLQQHKLILVTYLNELLMLKNKMTFGRQSFSCAVVFSWTDTIKGKEWLSYNIYFEIYNCLFNLGTCLYMLGKKLSSNAKDNRKERREAVLSFKQALFCFQECQNEAFTKISSNQLPYDLYPVHLEYYVQLCSIYGQMDIVDISKSSTEGDFLLQAKLLLHISDCFSKAQKMTVQKPTNKVTDEEYRQYLLNRVYYYRAVMYKRLKEGAIKKFNNNGQGYGEALYFQAAACKELMKCLKNVDLCGQYIKVNEFKKSVEAEKARGREMEDKNNKIYHQASPDPSTFQLEPKNLMKPLLPKDLFMGKDKNKAKTEIEKVCPELDLLVPTQTKEMIERYKKGMGEFIGNSMSESETESSINSFIQSLNLPKYLTIRRDTGERVGDIEIPPELWDKISHCQELGGTMGLSNKMQEIMNRSNFLMSNLQNTLNSFNNEENDDNMCRQKYGGKWVRKSSNELNGNYIMAIQNHISNLERIRGFDKKQNDDIINNSKYFEILGMPKEKLNEEIPGRVSNLHPQTEEEENLREEILKLYDLSDKTMGIIDPMYDRLNDDALLVNYFVEVLEKKTTEQAVFNQNSQEYAWRLEELKKLNEEIKKQKDVVSELTQKAAPKILKKTQASDENKGAMDYFGQLDKHANMYMDFYDKVQKGENYYNGLQQKIDQVIDASNRWMIKRNEEKNILISSILGGCGNSAYSGNIGGHYGGGSAFLDPGQNMYTNMGSNNRGMGGQY